MAAVQKLSFDVAAEVDKFSQKFELKRLPHFFKVESSELLKCLWRTLDFSAGAINHF